MKFFDDRTVEYVFPKRIVFSEGKISNLNYITKENDLQIFTFEPELIVVEGKASIILDYGCEMCGGIRFITKHSDTENEGDVSCKVRIRFGESVSETCSEIGEKGATNDHSVRDFYATIGAHSDMQFGNTGFRFVRIDFISDEIIAKIKSIVAVSVYRNISYKGNFKCSDERINKIYEVARRTCHLCMQSMLWDGIKRDRLVWIGDMHPEMLTIKSVFGYDKCIDDGLLRSVEHFILPEYINEKAPYSMWLVIILYDWYMQNGNFDLLTKLLVYIDQLFDVFDNCVNDDGDLFLPEYFLDWQTSGYDGEETRKDKEVESIFGIKSLLVIALDCAIKMYKIVGKSDDKLLDIKKRLLKNKNFNPKTKQVLAFSIWAKMIEPTKEVLNKITDGNSRGFSTFMSYYILKAIAEYGEIDKAIEILKEYYGAMLDKGATTFWEDFNIEWVKDSGRIDEFPLPGEKDIHGDYGNYCYKGYRHSLCHGWASGPVPFLTEYVLGVKVKDVGCKKIEIKPNLFNLDYVVGDYPTPYGIVHIEHKRINGEIQSKIDAPKEIDVLLVK